MSARENKYLGVLRGCTSPFPMPQLKHSASERAKQLSPPQHLYALIQHVSESSARAPNTSMASEQFWPGWNFATYHYPRALDDFHTSRIMCATLTNQHTPFTWLLNMVE